MNRNESQSAADKGYCICLECKTRLPHRSWVTCIERNCPACGAIMVREGSPYHLFVQEQELAHGGRRDPASRAPGKRNRNARADVLLGHSC